ncbi:MAG: hypothetical protein JOY99_09770 [Sphingomonadaceae bacterium]|nr:hypothetical protein [Sphingomonadaceae bacterium]
MPATITADGAETGVQQYTITLDEGSGTIRVTMRSFWTVEISRRFIAELGSLMNSSRARFGRVKVVSDITTMPIQSQEVFEIVSGESLYRAGDRLAIVLDSALAKIAARRVLDGFPEGVQREAFISPRAAETWLQAYS